MVIHYLKGKVLLSLVILSMASLGANDLDIVVGEPNTDQFPVICFTISESFSFSFNVSDLFRLALSSIVSSPEL